MFTRIVIFLSFAWQIEVVPTLEFLSSKSTTFKFSANSFRNDTGHWNARVKLAHRAGEEHGIPLDLDVEHAIINCEGAEFVIIEANITVPPPSIPAPGYEMVRGLGYYKLHKDLQNWHTARVICSQEGAHLAIINSHFEFSVMKMLFDRNSNFTNDWRNGFAFVGISDLQQHKHFVTIFDEPVNSTGYTNWKAGQPNYDGNCVDVDRNGKLHDTNCNTDMAFFCEKEF